MEARFTQGDQQKLRNLEDVLDHLSMAEVELKSWVNDIPDELHNEKNSIHRDDEFKRHHTLALKAHAYVEDGRKHVIDLLGYLRTKEAAAKIAAGT